MSWRPEAWNQRHWQLETHEVYLQGHKCRTSWKTLISFVFIRHFPQDLGTFDVRHNSLKWEKMYPEVPARQYMQLHGECDKIWRMNTVDTWFDDIQFKGNLMIILMLTSSLSKLSLNFLLHQKVRQFKDIVSLSELDSVMFQSSHLVTLCWCLNSMSHLCAYHKSTLVLSNQHNKTVWVFLHTLQSE